MLDAKQTWKYLKVTNDYGRVLYSWFHTPVFSVRNSILNWVSKTQSLKREKEKDS